MDISIFLSKVLGIYFLIVGLGMIVSRSKIKSILITIIKTPPLMFITGILALIIGILLIVSHTIWTMDWKVVITIIGWLSFIKGTFRIIAPEFALKTSKKCVESKSSYYISAFITLFIGLFLLYYGYFQNHY